MSDTCLHAIRGTRSGAGGGSAAVTIIICLDEVRHRMG
jgi:hypothetical protein